MWPCHDISLHTFIFLQRLTMPPLTGTVYEYIPVMSYRSLAKTVNICPASKGKGGFFFWLCSFLSPSFSTHLLVLQ